jgi:predicted nucleic-acid-binding Zn-ribbon protein
MSDENEHDPDNEDSIDEEALAIESLRFSDLNRFIIDKDAEKSCDACGYTGEWWIKTDADDLPSLHYFASYRNPDKGSLMFSMHCPNCSNTRFFDAIEVLAHLKSVGESHGQS